MKTIAPVQQLSLFSTTATLTSSIPTAIERALREGAALAISVSGGKDSDAMLRYLVKMHRSKGWTGELFAITADLGRIEWAGTGEHIRNICAELDVPLITVRRQKGSMIDRWDQRRQVLLQQQQESINDMPEKEGDKPFWSSGAARYCTKELKTAEVDRYLRRFKSVVCAVGIRAEESSSRAKKPRVQVRNDISTASSKAARGLNATQHEEWAEEAIALWMNSNCKGRLALTWNAVLDWPIEKVWETLGTDAQDLERRRSLYVAGNFKAAISGWPAHWAYVAGNSRLSCSMCVLASAADIQNGARHNINTWLELALMEERSGWSFQQDKWLKAIPMQMSDRIIAVKELHAVLQSLQLVNIWGMLFATTLLRAVPISIIMLWTQDTLLSLSEAIQS